MWLTQGGVLILIGAIELEEEQDAFLVSALVFPLLPPAFCLLS